MPLQNSSTTTTTLVSGASIPLLLEWWQQRKRVANTRSHFGPTLPKGDETYLQAYYRLMEVYSVIKAGGVQAQTEAVQAFAKRESGRLNQRLSKIETAPALSAVEKRQEREKIQQEIQELCSANDWRLAALTGIAPAEEDLVRQYLPDIERTLLQVQCA
ncbi:MAG: hypothetical protein WA783_20495 [Phormidesmis sp.]